MSEAAPTAAAETSPLVAERSSPKSSKACLHSFNKNRWAIVSICAIALIAVGTMCKLMRRPIAIFGKIPQPPTPYQYDSFLTWFDSQDWQSLGLKMAPKRTWFDAELAIQAYPHWFQGEDLTAPLQAVHSMRRFGFMEGIMETGDDSTQASIAAHLLMLHLVQEGLLRKQAVVVDAGCGNGALLRLMALLAYQGGSQANLVGFDLLPQTVYEARTLLAAEETRAPGPAPATVFQANIFDESAVRRGLQEAGVKAAEDAGSADVVVVSAGVLGSKAGRGLSRDELALETSKEAPLQPFVKMLRPGGLLLFPLCKEKPDASGMCDEDMMLLMKGAEGHIQVSRGGVSDKEFSSKFLALATSSEPGQF